MGKIIVYTLSAINNLGCLPECIVVDTDEKGSFLTHFVKINATNKPYYEYLFDETDDKLVDFCLRLDKNKILSKVNGKDTRSWEKLMERYLERKEISSEDHFIKQYLMQYVDGYLNDFFENLSGKPLYFPQGKFPFTWQKLTIEEEMPELYYCFDNQPNHIYFSLDVSCRNNRLNLLHGTLISRKKARVMLKNKIYEFEDEIDGAKLIPFFSKEKVSVSQSNAEEYIHKVIVPMVITNRVIPTGFEIVTVSDITNIMLRVKQIESVKQFSLFDDNQEIVLATDIVFELIFEYSNFQFWAGKDGMKTKVVTDENTFTVYVVERDVKTENRYIESLKVIGLDLDGKVRRLPYDEGFEWLSDHYKAIELAGIEVNFKRSKTNISKKIFVGKRSVTVEMVEERDWFDIKGKVIFGEFEIPFLLILNYIKQNKHQFLLPNGEYAQIPKSWFDEYRTLIEFCETEDGKTVISKHHCMLAQGLTNNGSIELSVKENMRNLIAGNFDKSYKLPVNFKGELRRYQHEGYHWLRLLDELSLGGCLADDMGLGKTIQTLCLLQWMKENNRGTNLLIAPTSLIYNWESEVNKFCPDLSVYVHTGNLRTKNAKDFGQPDILLTSYAILRRDKYLFSNRQFNYVILDEAQAIKNPHSNITQVCLSLSAKRFLTLTGTPIENSLSDLWSQVHFFNRNMLGSLSHFMQSCKTPNKQDLYRSLLKPFLLRRNKSEVLTDLPEKTIITQWCDMSEPQQQFYRDIRNSYRDKFIENTDKKEQVNAMILLEGLLRMRQSANHPVLVKDNYAEDSGKFDSVCRMLEDVVSQGDKVLVFSSFVEHLKLYKNHLDAHGILYCYLDGSTQDRQLEVEKFQHDSKYQVFLLSLKAGGVGLNLTSASYVFLLDPWWNPAAEAQAYDRAHRIGQKNNVFVYKFITKNSIEEKILKLQQKKLQLFDTMINGDNDILKKLNLNDVMNLID